MAIGSPIVPGPSLKGEFGESPRANTGCRPGVEPIDVAHQAVGDERAHALVLRHADQDVADDARLLVRVGRDHHHVAGLGELDRRVGREVVAPPAPHRERDAAEALCAGERTDAVVERAAPAVRVDHPAGRRGRERRTSVFRRSRKVAADGHAGGFVAMSDPFPGLRGRRGARPGGRRRAVRARPPWRQRCAARAPSRPKRRLRGVTRSIVSAPSGSTASTIRSVRGRGAVDPDVLGANAEDDVLGAAALRYASRASPTCSASALKRAGIRLVGGLPRKRATKVGPDGGRPRAARRSAPPCRRS